MDIIDNAVQSFVSFGARLIAGNKIDLGVWLKTHYVVECRKADGSLRWREDVYNTVVTVGKNKLLDATFKTGLASPAWYIGLIDGAGSPSINVADTMASHAGWTENTGYSTSPRPTWTPGTISAGAVDNSGSVASFAITATSTIYGAFMVDNSTVGGGSGTLYGAAPFSAPRSVISGDTLNVTASLSIS